MPATTNSTSAKPSMFPRAQTLSIGSPKVSKSTTDARTESLLSLSSKSSSSLFPRASALSMGSTKVAKAPKTAATSKSQESVHSSMQCKTRVLNQQSMTATTLFVGNKLL
ncbi:hypothetical protein BJ741DRAFT_705246 [Chytriomyces cf. hyalinus JEL632]|nr:hypothetical protein BJ741DRAFT_705246 [Chytriomyces cf. hyalinus JEL632]